MFIRVVKMHFKESERQAFLQLFEEVYPKISSFPGCTHLELWNDQHNNTIFFTYSHWSSPHDLEAYRQSELFKQTWERTKALFAHKAEAWSVNQMTPQL